MLRSRSVRVETVSKLQKRCLASILNSFSDFGDRVLRQARLGSDSNVWKVAGQVGIERMQWRRLCTQIMNILQLLSCDESIEPPELSSPDHKLLSAAALRARKLFGRFASADTDLLSIEETCSVRARRMQASAWPRNQRTRLRGDRDILSTIAGGG